MLTSQDVASAAFPIVKWRDGYEIDEVGAFMSEVAATLAAYEQGRPDAAVLTSHDVKKRALAPTRFREGLGQIEVKAFVKQIVATLRSYEPS